jgi:hypothetical protein
VAIRQRIAGCLPPNVDIRVGAEQLFVAFRPHKEIVLRAHVVKGFCEQCGFGRACGAACGCEGSGKIVIVREVSDRWRFVLKRAGNAKPASPSLPPSLYRSLKLGFLAEFGLSTE